MESENYEEGFREYIEGGLSEESHRRYRCAVDLYYKSLCQIIDFLLSMEGIAVNKLKDRMDSIRALNSGVYSIFAVAHGIYRSAYRLRKDKKDCKEIKNGIKKIIILKNIEGGFKEAAKQI